LLSFAPLGLSHSEPPLFSDDEHPVDKTFTEVKFALRSKIFGERFQHVMSDAFANPLLEPAMAGLVRGKPFGQIFPPCAASQDPEDAIHCFTAIFPRSAEPVLAARRFWDEWGNDRPLFGSQFFSSCHSFSLARLFMR
jgi:hypothetical protein